jgi:hypothetical protein
VHREGVGVVRQAETSGAGITFCVPRYSGSNPRGGRTLKPEFTFGRGLRQVARWWWVVAITTVVLAAVAVMLADRPYGGAKASARIHVQDTIVSFQFSGQPQPYTPNRNVNELTRADFIDPQVAAAAAKTLKGVTGQDLLSHIGFSPLTGTEASLTYDGSTPTSTHSSISGEPSRSRRCSAPPRALPAHPPKRSWLRQPMQSTARSSRWAPSRPLTPSASQSLPPCLAAHSQARCSG